jgi:hypothetical protein
MGGLTREASMQSCLVIVPLEKPKMKLASTTMMNLVVRMLTELNSLRILGITELKLLVV